MPLALVAAVTACDKGKGSSGGGASGPTGAAGAAAIAPAKGGLQKALAAMPADSELIIGMDFSKLRSSALYKKYEPMLMSAIGDNLKKFQDTCGFSPIEKLNGMLIGGKGRELDAGTIFIRGFDKTAATDCLKKREAQLKAEGKPAQLTIDGDYLEFVEDQPDKPMRALFVDDQTALMVKQGDSLAGKDVLTAAAAAKDGDGLTGSKTFNDLLAKTHTASALWFVIRGDAPMLSAAAMVKFKALYGSVDVGAGVSAEIRMWMNGADDAKSTASEFAKQLEQVKSSPFGSMLSDVTIKAEGEDVVIRAKLSQQQIEDITKFAGKFGGGGF
ncbi:MAG TPA: hypothetical protein VHE35_08595 [Kofleriaceae bacterium]|nr:hypothetical protein [Kofleriaceae bacterium]